jgi:fused signal recognition particle receptor
LTLEHGVARTRSGFVSRLRAALGGPDDDGFWDEVEEALIASDLGATLAVRVVEGARARHDLDPEIAVKNELVNLFAPRQTTGWPRVPGGGTPAVVLVVGVNGTGKTTTVAKLGHRFKSLGANVLLAAADTFRAAAIEQLEVWA